MYEEYMQYAKHKFEFQSVQFHLEVGRCVTNVQTQRWKGKFPTGISYFHV